MLLWLLSACTFISSAELADKLEQVDEDGDGYIKAPAGDDCDDGDATIHPGADDAWYDGVDSDCAGNDDYDQDADGAVEASSPDATAENTDCDDTDATFYPGADDAWYDGLDNDCAGNDDYDQDGDSFQREPEGSDCDDTNANWYPGAPDAWYDGSDSNCDGADDYDQDGDGFQREPEGSDCNDLLPAVNVDATESWYDGIDQDCDGADDYDQDADGFLHSSSPDVTDDTLDCDDTDAEVRPGELEDLGDARDLDCDGSEVGFFGMDSGFTLSGGLDLAGLSDGTEGWLVVGAASVDTGSNVFSEAVVGLLFDDQPELGPTGSQVLNASTSPLSAGLDLLVFGNHLYAGLSRISTSGRTLQLVDFPLDGSTPASIFKPESSGVDPFDDLALAVDASGDFHLVGCEPAGLQTMKPTSDFLGSSGTLDTGLGGTACTLSMIDASNAMLLVNAGTESDAYLFDPSLTSPTYTYYDSLTGSASDAKLVPHADGDLVAIAWDADDQVVVFNVATGGGTTVAVESPSRVDMVIDAAGTTYYVAWVDAAGEVGLAWGPTDLSAEPTAGSLSLDFTATDVGILLTTDETRVIVGAMDATQLAYGVALLP